MPEERGPAEAWPGKKAGTDEVYEEIHKDFCLADPPMVAPETRMRGATGAEGRLRDRMLFHRSRPGTVFMLNEPD